jgi:hypothetical protein
MAGLGDVGCAVGAVGAIDTQPITNVPTAKADANDRITRNLSRCPQKKRAWYRRPVDQRCHLDDTKPAIQCTRRSVRWPVGFRA